MCAQMPHKCASVSPILSLTGLRQHVHAMCRAQAVPPPVACRDRTTKNPESAIWNADLDEKGRTFHRLRMHEAKSSGNPNYRADLSASPTVAETGAWAKDRFRIRRAGGLPCLPSSTGGRKRVGKLSLRVWDQAPHGETRLKGKGKRVTERSGDCSDIKLIMGYFLYVHSSRNANFDWPLQEYLQPCRGMLSTLP